MFENHTVSQTASLMLRELQNWWCASHHCWSLQGRQSAKLKKDYGGFLQTNKQTQVLFIYTSKCFCYGLHTPGTLFLLVSQPSIHFPNCVKVELSN